ncbi:MAG TPA: discoidin domain-containing protein, partial [Candidatus Polarisedimenticolia bacterium]|nr:discoidin domain-containing protein [Candidatus Polarisedimenticolia bacterium]
MRRSILTGLILLYAARLIAAEQPISLAGTWKFKLDREDAGISGRWFQQELPDRVRLPGDLAGQGIGDRPSLQTKWTGGIQRPDWYLDPKLARYSTPGNFKFPYWLTPEHRYVGAAWYQREIEIPKNWAGRRVVLTLERPHWETRVWLDDQIIGTNTSLGTPHEYDLGQVAPGKHRLTIRVDNRMIIDIGENSHSISDHTQGNWNGIVGSIELRATPLAWIEDLQIYPQVSSRSIKIKGRLGNISGHAGNGTLTFTATPMDRKDSTPKTKTLAVTWQQDGASFESELSLGDAAQLWDEFNPALYKLSAVLRMNGEKAEHSVETTFGLREIGTQGTQFTINGRKTFFRGTLECAIFPRTGHPPTDLASWERIMKICRAHGLNMIRFHSWCPPEAAFEAADELGFYFQIECSSWANQSTTLGDGKPVDAWIYQEADRILKCRGNHPSLVLMLYGNEPGGSHASAYLEKWVTNYKAKDPRHLYSSGSGWPQISENQFHVTPDPRIQIWGAGLNSRINALPPETRTDYRDYIRKRSVPVISHEIGQWCVYPNFDEISKYTGYLKPRNFEIFRDSLNANGMGDQAHQFLLASGKLQALCYKEEIESALRTPGMGGFELLDLHDFPGQGTALVGVLDPFWDSKGYITAEEYRRFCNSTVPLARLAKRVFTSDESLEADLEAAHFGPRPITAVTRWKLVGANGKLIAAGDLPVKTIPVDNGISLGHIKVPLASAATPQQCKLVVSIEESAPSGKRNAESYQNDWDVWVYPPKIDTEPAHDITIVGDLNAPALEKLNAGGKVLLLIPPSRVRNTELDKVKLGFSSIFWNTAWTHRQAPTTLGILCDPKNPALAEFPAEFHSNWQWWYLINRAGAMILDGLPTNLHPTVQVIDDWVTNHRLALAFEARVGRGKLMVCSVDLKNELNADPVRRQFRRSLLDYMESKKFRPKVELRADQVQGLIDSTPPVKKLEVQSIKADSEEGGYEASNAIDADASTIWHTAWSPEVKNYPHELRLEFKSPRELRGFTVLPRQEGRNGWIKDYACYVSADGTNWGEPIARGGFSQDAKLKTVQFDKTVTARAIRFVALAGFGTDPYASMAEFSILEEGEQATMKDERGLSIRTMHGKVFEPAKSGVIPVSVDGRSDGLIFDGIGAVSAGGSSRLLVDYPEPQRSQILDYLFKPNYGAALQILKVEIGSDTDATCGSEPSHEPARGKIRSDAGYEWWLMKEAKARNPEIKLAALAWGAPGWLKGGFWSDDNLQYTMDWLNCARSNGLAIDYLGGGNERGWDADYYIKLAAALKKNGFNHIRLVATDDHNPPNYWSVATAMKKNPAFADAVDILGEHDICGWRTLQKHCNVSPDALELGKPLWDSENSTQDYQVGVEPLARVMTRHYIEGGITANFNWALIASWYGTFPCAGSGLMLADHPWSGFYDVGKIIWLDAHITQFTKPGWRYLDSACGYTKGGASFVTLRSPTSPDYTILIETVDLSAPETLEFTVNGGLSTAPGQVWSTDLRSENGANDFCHIGAVKLK